MINSETKKNTAEISSKSLNQTSSFKKVGHRVIELQNYDDSLLSKICSLLSVEAVGGIVHPTHGRIATNITQETNKGKLMIRIYPREMPQKLETGDPMFEVESLNHFSNFGVNVPRILKFGNELFFKTDDKIIFGYFLISGEVVEQSNLNERLAKNMGEFLNSKFLPVAAKYIPSNGDLPKNSFAHILDSAKKIENKYPELKESEIWKIMVSSTEKNLNLLDGTPVGIVHSDYFFENILIDKNNNVIGIIDFGDAYYSHLLHDIVIGAMEASVLENGTWNMDCFNAFLKETSNFLTENKFNFDQFFETLKVNCLRFATYTVSFTVQEGNPILENPYISRYSKLLSLEFQKEVSDLYSSSIESYESLSVETGGET